MYEGQRMTLGSQFSSTMWFLVLKLELLGLEARTFTHRVISLAYLKDSLGHRSGPTSDSDAMFGVRSMIFHP